MNWIFDKILDRIFGNLRSTLEAGVLALAAYLSTIGVTLSQSRIEQLTALALTLLVAAQRLFAKDAAKEPKTEEKK